MRDLQENSFDLIERGAARAVDMLRAGTNVTLDGLPTAFTRDGGFVDPEINPETGYPFVEVVPGGSFLAGDVVGGKAVEYGD